MCMSPFASVQMSTQFHCSICIHNQISSATTLNQSCSKAVVLANSLPALVVMLAPAEQDVQLLWGLAYGNALLFLDVHVLIYSASYYI